MTANYDPQQEREFILQDCADRLANIEAGPITVEQMSQIMLDRLADRASSKIIDYAKLGKVIASLNRDLEAEQPKGMYGIGKVFRTGFERISAKTGVKGTDAEIDAATNVLLDKFLGKVYELAEVERH